jgi:hypothetical protein
MKKKVIKAERIAEPLATQKGPVMPSFGLFAANWPVMEGISTRRNEA